MTIHDDVKAAAIYDATVAIVHRHCPGLGDVRADDAARDLLAILAPAIERATIERCKAALSAAEYVACKGAAIAILNALLPEESV